MFKIRLMAENIAEKVLGWLLPQVEAKAGGCGWGSWYFAGCCGTKKLSKRDSQSCGTQAKCEGVCPY